MSIYPTHSLLCNVSLCTTRSVRRGICSLLSSVSVPCWNPFPERRKGEESGGEVRRARRMPMCRLAPSSAPVKARSGLLVILPARAGTEGVVPDPTFWRRVCAAADLSSCELPVYPAKGSAACQYVGCSRATLSIGCVPVGYTPRRYPYMEALLRGS